MSNDRIKVAFVGAGNMAQEHIRAFSDIDGVVLTGICSRTRSRAEAVAEKYSIENVCDSIDELARTSQAQLLVIAVPELEVMGVCVEAFKHPWVCLVEKPAGYNLAEAQAISSLANELERSVYVAFNRRHYSSTRTVLNELVSVNGARLVHLYDQEDQIRARAGGVPELVVQNWMYANSVHVIDYLKVFCRGDVEAVEPIIRWQVDCPRFVMAKIVFTSGDVGIYEAVWNGPGPWAVTVTTQEKRWELRPLEQAHVQPYGSRKLEALPVHPWDIEFKPGLRLQAVEAIQAVLKKPTKLPTLEESVETMKLVSAIYA